VQVKKYRVLAWRLARMTGYKRVCLLNINGPIPVPHKRCYFNIQLLGNTAGSNKKYTRLPGRDANACTLIFYNASCGMLPI
jgi:hypothetical protein